MRKIISQKEFFERFKSKSLILSQPDSRHGKKLSASRPLYGLHETKIYLAQLLDQTIDTETGSPRGILKQARERLKKAKDAWKSWNKAQPAHARKDKPFENHAEKINERAAFVEMLELECRELNKIIEAAEEKEKKKQDAAIRKTKKRKALSGKLNNNVLVEMDTRKVIEGGTKFEDNGQLVADYIAGVKKERAKARKERNSKAAKQAAAADKFFKETGLTRAAA
ncbi:MAG: hypothetical protein SRB1_00633 [Desulfobacteraceae bacterium Eth-SRB1]|nr:MAG: hypothetical protein SRB1_00633 [Desulfobacteraceae bacterium Eth-SRB1]